MTGFEIDDDDAIAIGTKVVEMAERVRKFDQMIPGAQAKWFFEADDVRFKVTVTVANPEDAAQKAGA